MSGDFYTFTVADPTSVQKYDPTDDIWSTNSSPHNSPTKL